MTNKGLITLILLLYCSWGKAEPVTIPGTEVNRIHSAIVNQPYKLLVQLPAGYTQSAQHYPVVYLLDAQWDFPLVSSIYGQQYYDGFVPELIIVGITWGGDNPDADQLRRRDFTPTDVEHNGVSGGADKFLAFIRKELIPFVDQQYRTTAQRTLMGSSLGGLFTLYSLFKQPDLFDSYIPSSPAVTWDNNVLYSYTEHFENRIKQPTKLFMPVSELEGLYQPVMQFAAFLHRKNYPNLQWQQHTVMGAGHSGVKAEGDTRGLQYVFQQPEINLTAQQLAAYSGIYLSSQGKRKLRISVEEGGLHLHISQQQLTLSAAGKMDFYHRGTLVKLHFNLNTDNSISGLDLVTYGNSQHFDKQ